MFGIYQHSNLRIEINASANCLRDCLLCPEQFQQWLNLQRFSPNLPDRLQSNDTYTSWFGLIPVQHQVQIADSTHLQLLLSQGIDGFHQWVWGDGWIQSRLEGISVLPLNLGQTYGLLRLKQFVETGDQELR